MIMSFMYIFSMSDIEVRLNLFSLCAILPKKMLYFLPINQSLSEEDIAQKSKH